MAEKKYVTRRGESPATKTKTMPIIVLIILCVIICASLGWVSLIPIVGGFVLGIIADLAKMDK